MNAEHILGEIDEKSYCRRRQTKRHRKTDN